MANETPSLLTRRTFLQSTAATAVAAAATFSAVGCQAVTVPAADADPQPVEETGFWNHCRGNCGASACRIQGIVREGKLVRINPVTAEPGHPYHKTGCVKGQFNPQRVYSTKRVLYPLKRVGERGSGEFERIGWDEAIELAAQKFLEVTSEYGDAAAGVWQSYGGGGSLGGVGWYFPFPTATVPHVGLSRFVGATGCTVVAPAADLCQMWMNVNLPLPSAYLVDILDSKTIIFWASNPTEATRDGWQYAVEAREKGATLITINPEYNKTAAGSDMWLPIRPATDGYMMLAMANYIVDNHMEDNEFLATKTVAPFLVKEDGSYLRMSDLGVKPTVNNDGTEVDSEAVWDEDVAAFATIKEATKAAIHGSYDANGFRVQTVLDYVLSGIKEFTVSKAAEICGIPQDKIEQVAQIYATNKPAGIYSYQGLGHHYNGRHNYKNLNLLAALTGNAYKPGTYVNIRPLTETGVILGNTNTAEFCEVENAKTPVTFTSQYLPVVMDTGGLGGRDIPLKWVLVHCANPLASESGRQELIRAFGMLDFLVVTDPYLSDTALYADLILPVALSWETLDADGGYSLFEKALEPAGECKSMMDIYRLLSAAIGFEDLYPLTDEEYCRGILDTEANRENGFTYDDYIEHGFIRKFQEGATNVMASGSYATDRLRFYVEFMPSKDVNGIELNQDIERRPYWEPSLECNPNSAEAKKYPLYAISNHNNYTAHSMITGCEWQKQLYPGPELIISESAAIERGISTNDYVRAFNDRGECVLRAVVSKGIQAETVVLPHGWQSHDYVKGHHQDLTRIDMDPVTGNSAYNEIMCEVEKWDEEVIQ